MWDPGNRRKAKESPRVTFMQWAEKQPIWAWTASGGMYPRKEKKKIMVLNNPTLCYNINSAMWKAFYNAVGG